MPAVLLALLMPLLSAHAALITVDSVAGPGTAVLDTHSGNTWLKLSVTAGLTPDAVFDAMSPDGRFEGFRYPDYGELTCGLLGPNTGLACPDWTTFNADPVWAFFSTFGLSERPTSRIYHTPLTFTGQMPERYIFGSYFYYYSEPRPEFDFDTQLVLLNDWRLSQPVMHWLVRDAQDIAEPSTAVLLCVGAFVFVLQRRRRKDKNLPEPVAAS